MGEIADYYIDRQIWRELNWHESTPKTKMERLEDDFEGEDFENES